MWLRNPATNTTYSWAAATNYCESLDGSNGRGGYTDWRLPNIRELETLVDFANRLPALPAGHPFTTVVSFQSPNNFLYYWSSTVQAPVASSVNAWKLSFGYGDVTYAVMSSTAYLYAWPVRGGN
jgi:hypothetical protein